MNYKAYTIALLAIATFTGGCKQEPTTAQQIDKVVTDTKEAAKDLKDYTYAQKAEFTAKMKLQLAEIKGDLDLLEAKVEKSSEAVKLEAKPQIKALREQEALLHKQLDVVENSTESTWEEVKKGSRNAYESFKEGFQKSRQWVSDKIAP